MAIINAEGIHVRHAITRALATSNRSLMESTWRVVSARTQLDTRGRVVSGQIALQLEAPQPLDGADLSALRAVVNPDGLHPLMALIPGTRTLMDVFPVTWDRWLRGPGHFPVPPVLPPTLDPWTPRVGLDLQHAADYARSVGKRLPTRAEFRAAWGAQLHPWGDQTDPHLGRPTPPRFGFLFEAGMHPPNRNGFFDLGQWLHHWTADGTVLGGLSGPDIGDPGAEPCGFRCVQEV